MIRRLALIGCWLCCLQIGISHARSLEDIQASGYLDICVQEDNAPFSNQLDNSGIFLDVAGLLATNLGTKTRATWLVSAEYVRKTGCDVVPAVADIPNDDPLKLSVPYFTVRTTVVSRKDAPPLDSLADLGRGKIAVLANSLARHDLNQKGLTLSVAFLENDDVLKAVDEGEDFAGVVTLPSFEWYVHQHAAPLRSNAAPLEKAYDYDASLGLRKGDAALVVRANAVLERAITDGSLTAIFGKYGLTYEAPAPRPTIK